MTLDDARAELLTLAGELDRVVQVVSSQDGESTERQKCRAAALRLVLDALPTREQLKALEWSADALCEGDQICPVCLQNRHERVHADDCWLARLLG